MKNTLKIMLIYVMLLSLTACTRESVIYSVGKSADSSFHPDKESFERQKINNNDEAIIDQQLDMIKQESV